MALFYSPRGNLLQHTLMAEVGISQRSIFMERAHAIRDIAQLLHSLS